MENEEWRDIPGWEGYYQVSNYGDVKSLSRSIKKRGQKAFMSKERIIKSSLTRGYKYVKLYRDYDVLSVGAHQLVAMAFLGHERCGYKLVVNHRDLNPLNNHVDNLEIVTHRENTNMKHIASLSKYTGVTFHKGSGKWQAHIKIGFKYKYLGQYSTEEEASAVYERTVKEVENGQEISFKPRKRASNYRGVVLDKWKKKWRAQIGHNGKNKYLGVFDTEIEASNAYQKALKELNP